MTSAPPLAGDGRGEEVVAALNRIKLLVAHRLDASTVAEIAGLVNESIAYVRAALSAELARREVGEAEFTIADLERFGIAMRDAALRRVAATPAPVGPGMVVVPEAEESALAQLEEFATTGKCKEPPFLRANVAWVVSAYRRAMRAAAPPPGEEAK